MTYPRAACTRINVTTTNISHDQDVRKTDPDPKPRRVVPILFVVIDSGSEGGANSLKGPGVLLYFRTKSVHFYVNDDS